MSYTAAVTHPFEPEAEGAQVPDMYTFPTQTSVLRTAFNIQIAPGQTNVDFVVQPNPFCTIAASSPNGINTQISGGVVWSDQANPYNSTQGFVENGLVSPDTLSQTYARYRVVGWGVRVRCVIAPINQQGEIAMVKVPSLSHFMMWPNYSIGGPLAGQIGLPAGSSWNQPTSYSNACTQYCTGGLSNSNGGINGNYAVTWSDYLEYYGLPGVDSSGYITTAILAAPLAHHMNVAQLTMDSGVEIAGKIGSPDAYKWRDAANAVGYFEGYNQPTGAKINLCSASQLILCTDVDINDSVGIKYANQVVGVNDEDFVQQGGWSVLAFRASGMPSYSTSTTVFTVDIIMHIEGVPQFQSAPAISGAKYPMYHPRMLEAVQAASSAMPTFRKPGHKHRRKSLMSVMDAVSRELTGKSVRGNFHHAVHHGISQATMMAREAITSFEENPELAAAFLV